MGLIVISRVLKYRALILGVVLVATLAFFQSNQALDETSTESNTDNPSSTQSDNPETPSTPETPEVTETPEVPDEEVSDDTGFSTASVRISIKTSTGDGGSGESSEEETTIEEITNGSISLQFTSNDGGQRIKKKIEEEDGRTSVSFRSKYDQDSKSDVTIENSIEREEEID